MSNSSFTPPLNKKMKISRVSIVEQVCTAIKKDIAAGTWKEGDKLPSEAEFAEAFGVNRLSVRMALQKLSALGIIETRVGEGSFVRPFSLGSILTEVSIFYEGSERYQEVQQLRNLLEYECMRQALYRSTDEEKDALKKVLERYYERREIYYKDLDDQEALAQLVDADFAFHYEVTKMSHNELYSDIYLMVQQLIRSHITELISARCRRRFEAGLPPFDKSEDTHQKVYNCIIDHDEAALRRAMDEMLGLIPVKGMDVFG